ncbi:MAG TPA: peptidoglycan DD-metalloendopeptidase family protein [Methylophilaceae bacterium]|nr:peptidoglycan DD-metalloendopeptidase family protein [Methylophilaceae bacterium]
MPARLLLLVALWALASPAWSASKVEKTKQNLEELHDRIEALKKELGSTEEKHNEAADELKQSEQAISEANRKLYELNRQHKQSSKSLGNLQQQKTELESTLQQQQKLLGTQLYQQYLHGRQGYVQILLQQQDPGAIARQLQYYSYVSRARATLIESMHSNLEKVAKLNDEAAAELQHLAELKEAQEKERQELQSQKQERRKLLSQLSAKIKSQRGEIDKLKRDEKRLSDLVEKLSRVVIRKPPPAKKNEPSKPIGRNETLPSNSFSGNFAALKGKLNLPVKGDIANRFGDERKDTGVSWKGLFIKSPEGSEVKSVAPGTVVFADWLRGFGNLLIIDHGDSYMTLYANNQALLKKVGEEVKGGDTIASVGNSGGNEEPGLYFELRHQSKPIDPLSWSTLR